MGGHAPGKAPTLRQIVDPKTGKAAQGTATEPIWVGYGQEFSPPRAGNTVTPYTTGAEYLGAVADAMLGAGSEICMAGWQINWDALMKPGLRLFDVLLTVAKKKSVKIYVMPWKHQAPVQTFHAQTEEALNAINEIVGVKDIISVKPAPSQSDETEVFFSHHQKHIVIDRKTAFLGGIDICYGRFDDATYDLDPAYQNRFALNRYNGCVPPVASLAAWNSGGVPGSINPDDLDAPVITGYDESGYGTLEALKEQEKLHKQTIGAIQDRNTFQVPYADESPVVPHATGLAPFQKQLDSSCQPRMPWQDSAVKIEGPSASDVYRNFVWRWNSLPGRGTVKLPPPPAAPTGTGGCQVQVLRSGPAKMRTAEYKNLSSDEKKTLKAAPGGAQNDIFRAMASIIGKAQHFIYIENQFFVSAFGTSSIPEGTGLSPPAAAVSTSVGEFATRYKTSGYFSNAEKQPPQNRICQLLGDKIENAIFTADRTPFHVCIVLPVHPEGRLDAGSIIAQVYWTMQSLSFGSHSLINRVKRAIRAREIMDKSGKFDSGARAAAFREAEGSYKDVRDDQWAEYLTLLNLRNWQQIGKRFVTEQIYVHNKMMIVDDLYAIVGSANINDRSLLGSRDSELAVLVMDTDSSTKPLRGDGKPKVVRTFAHELRKAMWKKIFGITGNVRPAMQLSALIEQPAAPATWKMIQSIAADNTALYEDAFSFIPRNTSSSSRASGDSASIWPPHDQKIQKIDPKTMLMPFNENFWAKHFDGSGLSGVKGLITLLPDKWTREENNNIPYSSQLLVFNELPVRGPNQTEIASNQSGETEVDV